MRQRPWNSTNPAEWTLAPFAQQATWESTSVDVRPVNWHSAYAIAARL